MAELDALLDRVDPGHPADLVATIRARLPETSDPKITEIVTDAERARYTERHRNPDYVSMNVTNGNEYLVYVASSKDAQIHKHHAQAVYLPGVGSFTYWPTLAVRPAGWGAKPGVGPAIRRTEGPDGRLTIEHETEHGTPRWVVDRTTGFVHAYSARPKRPNPSILFEEEVRQYGPKAFADGVVLPTVQVRAQLSGDRIQYIAMKVVDEVDLAHHPGPLDFAMAVPAGTLIVDRRESSAFPNQGIAHYPVADVIAFADEMAVRYRSIEPVVKIGQPAPPIEPAAWFDRDGPAEAPALAGKVVLVDFWGITCKPCMAELPEVQAAADRFAARGRDFALIGIHNSGPTAEAGAGFALKQGLTYRLAIDRPAGEEGWIGATFQSYGVRPNALPAAAVIDRQGKVAFVGPFREALRKAADLLGR
jgi:thiol-disulfide isomerase/thioredoxin